MKTYILKGVERLTGEYNGKPFDTFRFNFVARSRNGFGSIPFISGGKLPSIKGAEMCNFFDDFDIDKPDFGLGDLLGRSFNVFTDSYGRIQCLYAVS